MIASGCRETIDLDYLATTEPVWAGTTEPDWRVMTDWVSEETIA